MTIAVFPLQLSENWYGWATDIDYAARVGPMIGDATVTWTANGTLVAGVRNAVFAGSSAIVLQLPAPFGRGQNLLVERTDSGTSTVTINASAGATLRGDAAGVITMPGVGAPHEAVLLVAESATSWAVAAGQKTKTWLDAIYAPKASPAFTGTPTAPTAATADNSTTLATTAWVKAQGYAGGTGSTPADATATAKGIIMLTGDLGGTAGSPTVPGLAAKAPLASPAFTGTPTAPTAAVDTATTQLATTAWTINQGYAKLVSPALTGTPTVPTAPAGTATTQAASTAFATAAALLAQQTLAGINSQGGSYTPVLADAGKLLGYSSTSAGTFTIPNSTTTAFPVGTVLNFALFNTGALTLVGASGVTLQSPAGLRLTTQYAQASAVQYAANQWLISGQTVA